MEVDVQVGDEIITVEAPDDATDEQIIAAVQGQQAPAASQPTQPEAPRTDLQRLGNVVQSIRSGQPGENLGSDALNLVSAPFRGVRATAIGAGKLLAGEGLQKSVSRANEALQPDFKPENLSEKVANVSSGIMEIAAPLGQASRATKLGKGLTQLSPFTLKGASQNIEKLHKLKGVITDTAIQPIRGAKEATEFVNNVNRAKKAKILESLGGQELYNVEVKLRNLLDAEKVGKFGRLFGKKPKGLLTDQGVKIASNVKEAVTKAQNKITPGLGEARDIYGGLATRNRLLKRAAILGAAEVGRRTLGSGGNAAVNIASEVSR